MAHNAAPARDAPPADAVIPAAAHRPLVHVGWLLAADFHKEERLASYQDACRQLQETAAQQFPQFQWRVDFLHRYRYAPRGALDPLPLLELGVQEKIAR
ncbi:MAG: hypothetical protein KC425_27110, partial [Anaerolineales bacterium]|nr:hypothetical protein [Anaerolineales bacterium]